MKPKILVVDDEPDALEILVSDVQLRGRMGRDAQEFAVRELSMERQILGFVAALTYAKTANQPA